MPVGSVVRDEGLPHHARPVRGNTPAENERDERDPPLAPVPNRLRPTETYPFEPQPEKRGNIYARRSIAKLPKDRLGGPRQTPNALPVTLKPACRRGSQADFHRTDPASHGTPARAVQPWPLDARVADDTQWCAAPGLGDGPSLSPPQQWRCIATSARDRLR